MSYSLQEKLPWVRLCSQFEYHFIHYDTQHKLTVQSLSTAISRKSKHRYDVVSEDKIEQNVFDILQKKRITLFLVK